MATPIVMPKLGMLMVDGAVNRWLKSSGEFVEMGEPVAEIETEKINYQLEATGAGTLHTMVSEGAIVAVDGVLGYLLEAGETPPDVGEQAPEAPQPAAMESTPPAPTETTRARQPALSGTGDVTPSTPGSRRLARELGIDLASVTASGPRGRVVEANVQAYADRRSQSRPNEHARTEPLAGIRKAVASHMLHSITSTAQLTFFLEVDVTEAQRLRREASGGSLTIGLGHVLMKACAEAFRWTPQVNTVLLNGEILHFDSVNIGFAVALDEGLLTPVVHDVQDKAIAKIAQEVQDLSARATGGKMHANDLAGATFTISVLGSVDGFTPILSSGQNGLLGVGRSIDKPVVRGGEIVVREMCTLSLTVDHQVVDGAVAAAFLRRLQSYVERPSRLFS